MKQVLVCTKCNEVLSQPVSILEEGKQNYPKPDWRDESSPSPPPRLHTSTASQIFSLSPRGGVMTKAKRM